MKHKKLLQLIIIGLFVHILLLVAAFELYFSSPIDHGMKPVKTTNKPPAKRVVLIVADGLRASAINGKENEHLAPYLTNIRKTRGSWGISHTRVPTESRPGHVAILAGIYEDPSAVLKGWKKNPVDFDSVVNQSTNAWCWGSPDIIDMFNKENLSHIHLYSYDDKMQDFGKSDTTVLDFWVFKQVDKFFKLPPKEINQNGNLFFLHLLGIDTAGHGYKPNSKQYKKNIEIVDEYLAKIEELFEFTFYDESTAYVFTSDHGMTNWGSHGAGSDDETLTPIITWGAGIKIENIPKNITQIDIAPMLSSLIGINLPTNSLGKIPYEYFDVSNNVLSEMMMANVKQLVEIFNVKKLRTEKHALHFVPYIKLNSAEINHKIHFLSKLANEGSFKIFINNYELFIKELHKGIDYYQNYYKSSIQLSVTIGFIGWILYVLRLIVTEDVCMRPKMIQNQKKITKLFIILYIVNIILLFIQSVPVTYYFYFLFPFVMFHLLVLRYFEFINIYNRLYFDADWDTLARYIGLYLIGIELMFFGFYNRYYYSLAMCFMGLWMYIEQISLPESLKFRIVINCCFVIAIFPLFPEMKTTFNIYTYTIGSLTWIVVFLQVIKRFANTKINVERSSTTAKIQINNLAFAVFFHYMVEWDFISADSLSKKFAWCISILPILFIPASPKAIYIRLTTIFLGFAPFYVLVSPNYEVLFITFYMVFLYSWLIFEMLNISLLNIYKRKFVNNYRSREYITYQDFRRGFFFMIILLTGFFGTGNIASLNSFDPMWVRCFLTVFSPFTMTILILLKIIVPFIFACCTFRAIILIVGSNLLKMFCIVMLFSDILVLQFFYYITNVGSWLEIGISISHFIIMQVFVIILLLLYGIGHILTSTSYSYGVFDGIQ